MISATISVAIVLSVYSSSTFVFGAGETWGTEGLTCTDSEDGNSSHCVFDDGDVIDCTKDKDGNWNCEYTETESSGFPPGLRNAAIKAETVHKSAGFATGGNNNTITSSGPTPALQSHLAFKGMKQGNITNNALSDSENKTVIPVRPPLLKMNPETGGNNNTTP